MKNYKRASDALAVVKAKLNEEPLAAVGFGTEDILLPFVLFPGQAHPDLGEVLALVEEVVGYETKVNYFVDCPNEVICISVKIDPKSLWAVKTVMLTLDLRLGKTSPDP